MRPSTAAAAIVMVITLVAACASTPTSTPTPTPNSSPSPSLVPSATPTVAQSAGAISFDEFRDAVCASFDSLFLGVGNPDTASGSVLSKSLDQAMAQRDAAAAAGFAAAIKTHLETGRRHAATAARWPSAAPMMAAMDRVLVAFEAMVAEKGRAAGLPADAPSDPQKAFEDAGGVTAWTAMLEAVPRLARPSGDAPQTCPTVPVAI